MSDPDHRIAETEALRAKALRAEARAWLRRLTSGEATGADAAALEEWRARSSAHGAVFAEAALLWSVAGEAAQRAEARPERDAAAQAAVAARNRFVARRAFLAGGGALAASVAGTLLVRPPFDVWPSLQELTADYRTSTGERRQIDLASHLSIEMNTRTSVDVRPPADGATRIELLAGEAAITTRAGAGQDLVVIAGSGRAAATNAAFNIRKENSSVAVACIAGEVQVACPAGTAEIHGGQHVAYDEHRLSDVAAVDPDVITAWQRGLLVFRRVPLARVIDEVNRYRPGRIVLLDAQLGRRQVVANFRLDRIDEVVDFIAKAMNMPIRSLPGGIVLVG